MLLINFYILMFLFILFYYLFIYLFIFFLNWLKYLTGELCDDNSDHNLHRERQIRRIFLNKPLEDHTNQLRATQSNHHNRHSHLHRALDSHLTGNDPGREPRDPHDSEQRGRRAQRHKDGRERPVDAAGRGPEAGDPHGEGVEDGPAEAEVEDPVAEAAGADLLEEDDHGPDVDEGEEEVDEGEDPVDLAGRGVDHRALGDEEEPAQNDAEEVGGEEGGDAVENVEPGHHFGPAVEPLVHEKVRPEGYYGVGNKCYEWHLFIYLLYV